MVDGVVSGDTVVREWCSGRSKLFESCPNPGCLANLPPY
jgi:hypothetical protein